MKKDLLTLAFLAYNDSFMKALTEKFDIVKDIALEMGLTADSIRKWKRPGRGIPPRLYLQLIANSKRKLTMSDFLEDA